MTFEKMVSIVTEWLSKAPQSAQADFKNCPFDQLVSFHHSLGRNIRNEFKLWGREWEPQIEYGVDISDNHPDSISMRVIEEVWKRANNS